MSEWWDGIWNDPIDSNPWAFGTLCLFVLAALGLLARMWGVRAPWRRKRETMNDPTDNQPIAKWGQEVPKNDADLATATEVIAAATGRPRETSEAVPEWDRVKAAGPAVPPVATVAAPESWGTGLPQSRDEPDTLIQQVPPVADRGPWAEAPAPSRRLLSAAAGRSPVPAPMVSAERADCPHCGGTGYVPSINDYLRESIALVGDAGDDVIRQFYATLLRAAPDLASLFPADLLAADSPETVPDWADFTDEGKHEMLVRAGLIGEDDPLPPDPQPPKTGRTQRDMLLKALVALSESYDPGNSDAMAKLDTVLERHGRWHAAFVRPDGTIKGATWEEYAAVKVALFATLVKAAGAAWKPEYTAAWSQAYDYAAGVMLVAQFRSGFTSPRFPRA